MNRERRGIKQTARIDVICAVCCFLRVCNAKETYPTSKRNAPFSHTPSVSTMM